MSISGALTEFWSKTQIHKTNLAPLNEEQDVLTGSGDRQSDFAGHHQFLTGNGHRQPDFERRHQVGFAGHHQSDFAGQHQELDPMLGMVERKTGLIHAESMDMTNDPRFFQSNVLNKRLAAFSSLSVVSGLMVGFATSVISMNKDLNFWTLEGQLQLAGLFIMTLVLFTNVIATYIGVAQLYHSYRLETTGPTGFEVATSYYLNPNIVAWRHLAVKGMLNSLPLYLIATGLRIEVNFVKATDITPGITLFEARLIGLFFMALFAAMGVAVYYIHEKHMAVFRDRYNLILTREMPFMQHVHGMMSKRDRKDTRPLDV
jgi:hypothetical protein